MGKDDKGHRVTIIVAIIGLVGILGAAMIGVIPTLIERCGRTTQPSGGETKPKREPGPVPSEEPKREIVSKDGVPMVLIPAGYIQGLHHDAFYMDKYEVTNAAYKKFMNATNHGAPRYWDDPEFNKPGHPVVGVTWDDAVAYCKSAGKRLPTEAEWEYAARGGLVGKEYPWGDEEPTHDNANYSGVGGRDRWEYTAPVGSFPPNGYRLYDMAGNVWEWCQDWYDWKEIGRVLRGGSWRDSPDCLRVANRGYDSPTYAGSDVGFRCVSQDTDVTP